MTEKIRIAIAHTGKAQREVAQYLPANYSIIGRSLDNENTIIAGRDNAGWTLDAYVIPRLGSALIHCEEITADIGHTGPDFHVAGSGTVYLLIPRNDRARKWITQHIADDAQRLGEGVAIEHRYILDIAKGIDSAGLTYETVSDESGHEPNCEYCGAAPGEVHPPACADAIEAEETCENCGVRYDADEEDHEDCAQCNRLAPDS